MSFSPSKKWHQERVEWRHKVLGRIRDWVKNYDKATHNVLLRRLEQLEMIERIAYPKEYFKIGRPYDPADAAAMIVMPREKARRLAHRIFQKRRTVVDDWVKRFNLDWFDPEGFK